MGNDRLGHRGAKLLLLLIAAVSLAGCARTPQVSYYQLSTRHDVGEILAPFASSKDFTIGLGPLQLPEYLERIQIVSRTSANQLEIMGYRRWAEPLSTGLPRVLGEDLAFLLGNIRVLRYPWARSQSVDRQVIVEILQFEGGPEREVKLTARWTVLDGAGNIMFVEQRSSFQIDAAPGTEGLVAALSDALWRLAREIAASLAGPSAAGHS